MRDDPLPLASLAADLLARAAEDPKLLVDPRLKKILEELGAVVPLLQMDEPHYRGGEAVPRVGNVKP